VPCTRLDIKDIGYFMKDWKADYERHVSLGFSVNNIKGFSTMERTLYITHGYGHYLPINAREVFVREDKCFDVDWIETETHNQYELTTAKLSAGMEGVSTTLLSEYLDRHLDQGFENFVDDYFEGTAFITEILKTAYRYYEKEKTPSIRKALKLVLAYNLTVHITMVEGLSDEEQFVGRIDDPDSKFSGKTVAPVMINFQVKCALADMWRELQKDILEELSLQLGLLRRQAQELAHHFHARRHPARHLGRDAVRLPLPRSRRTGRQQVLRRHGDHSRWRHRRPVPGHLHQAAWSPGVGYCQAPQRSRL
jgi:hypothetical protein